MRSDQAPPIATKPVDLPKPELRVSELTIKNATLSATIFNGGPSDYTKADGGRQLVVSFPGGEGVFPAGEVPELKNGATTTVEVKLADLVSAIKFDLTKKTELTLALTPPADRPDNDAKTISYTPPGERKDESQKAFVSRLVRVMNATREPVTVFWQYRADEDDSSAWLPDGLQSQQGGGPTPSLVTFSFELKPGDDRVLTNQDIHITGSRARIFARGQSRRWDDYRNRDLWLVPEIDGGKHQYKAAAMETFTYRLALRPGSADAVPLDANDPPKGRSATEFAVSNLTPPVLTTPVTPDIPLPPLPAVLQPPPPPVGPVADLAVIHFTISPEGRFDGTVVNLGPADYPGKRSWYVLDQSGTPIAQGDIHPLGMNDQIAVSGQITGITAGAAYFLRLSPGDKNEGNDSAGLIFKRSSKSDLAVSKVVVEVNGGVALLKATITNNGPDRYVAADGLRKYTMGDQAGRLPSDTGAVPDLDVMGTTKVTMNVSALSTSNGVFFVTLGGSDADPTNDSGQYPFTAPGGGNADLAISDLKIDGTRIRATVTNNGPEDYKKSAGRTLKFSEPDATETVLPDIANKESKIYFWPLAALPTTATTYSATLSPGDNNPGNDTLDTKFDPANAAAKTSNLDVVSLDCDGTTVTAKVLNRGPDDLDTVRKIVFTADLAGSTPVEKTVPMPLTRNDTITVTVPLSDIVGPLPAPGEILVLQASPREGGGNGFKLFKVPGNPVAARSVDLAVDTPVYDTATDRFTVKVSNLGPKGLTVKPRIRVKAFGPGLPSWTQVITLDPIPKGGSVDFPDPASPLADQLSKKQIITDLGATTTDVVTIAFEILVPGSVTDPDLSNNRSHKSFVPGPPATAHKLKATALAYDHPTRSLTLTVENTGTSIYPGVPGWTYQLTSSNPAGLNVVRAIPPIAAAGSMSPHVELVPAAFVQNLAGQTVTYTLTIFDDTGAPRGPTASDSFTVPDVPILQAVLHGPAVADTVTFDVTNVSATTPYAAGRKFAVYAFDPVTFAEQEIEPPLPLPPIGASGITPVGWLTRINLKATHIPTNVGARLPGGWSKFRFRLKLSPPSLTPANDIADDTVDYPVLVSKPQNAGNTLRYDLAIDDISNPVAGPPLGKVTVTVTVKNIGECDHDFPGHHTQRTLKLFQNGKEVGTAGTIKSPLVLNEPQAFPFVIDDFPPNTSFEAKISPDPADVNPANDTMPKTLGGGKAVAVPISYTAPFPNHSTVFGGNEIHLKIKNLGAAHSVKFEVFPWDPLLNAGAGGWKTVHIGTDTKSTPNGDSMWGITLTATATKYRVVMKDTAAGNPVLAEYECPN